MSFAQPIGKYLVPFLFLLRYQANRIRATTGQALIEGAAANALRQAGDMVD
jgi:hypothetical protein